MLMAEPIRQYVAGDNAVWTMFTHTSALSVPRFHEVRVLIIYASRVSFSFPMGWAADISS